MSESTNPQPEERQDDGGSREFFVISRAARMANMHAQTLRSYDRLGLVSPQRASGGGRRYSREDINRLLEIQRLSHEEGVNLAGIKTIIRQQQRLEELRHDLATSERKVRHLAARVEELTRRLQEAEEGRSGGRPRGEIVHVPRSTAVVMWEPRRRRR